MMLNGFFRSWTMDCAKRPMMREAFGLNHFAQVQLVEFAQAMADLLQQTERQGGRTFDERKHFAARDEINLRGLSAMAVAERGTCSMTAISPKISPGPSWEKTRRVLPPTNPEISTSPSLTK